MSLFYGVTAMRRVSLASLRDDDDDNDALALLWRRKRVAKALNVSEWTVGEYVKRQIIPPPLQMVPGGPDVWLAAGILAAIEKRRRARRVKRPPRGRLLHHGAK